MCLFNMDDRNYDIWRNWSSQSDKYDEKACSQMWYIQYPKNPKYNLGFNKIRDMARQDSPEEFKFVQSMRAWAAKKSAATGKKWEVYLTGAEPTINETATAGATSAANIGTVDAPHISPGKARGKKSYLGSPSTGSGTKAPPQPKVVQPKTKAGTAVNALDMKGANLFGQPAKESAVIKRR